MGKKLKKKMERETIDIQLGKDQVANTKQKNAEARAK